MFNRWTERMDLLGQALQLRAYRQQVLASNIANADTPGYVARDFDFRAALARAQGGQGGVTPTNPSTVSAADGLAGSDPRHLRTVHSRDGVADRARLAYTARTQPSLDQNTVDLDQQRANFVDNAVQYETTLRFINGHVKTMLSAIQGQ
ncbi:flagellar basal body rod protein FlgB [Tepidimonas taiwanensis]|uniref:Flagellar basal body rod protein FlgB n=1 Tax=Tepidimonas taiwanensis TaxID=307486 RepID=A0A554XCG1_9BURK|nr:flagellar basal body rod protein FlgB [Tepidimonas taiwanensis]MCX7693292.1 flagellar basal body rod protein FlgB [Tepidimonas taiwanensis]MDM7464221.1 flagellar basal body rod protein FlgB [Tepidimonas taiwanensis]TSE33523.1 Flagellar basal body rod protein FlgB [Tepidimonas taiwanensis]UBQ05775.1 flagellar basal body rod protein FlgB [Tepidimonas taiwanensis]